MLARIGEIAELFTWLGLLTGVIVLLAGLVVRLLEGTWLTAEADVAEIDGDLQLAWLADDGQVYRRFLDPEERHAVGAVDRVTVHYRHDRPLRAHLDKRTHGSRVLVLLGLILTGVGIVAAVAQIVVVIALG
jgi:hypothetical protein